MKLIRFKFHEQNFRLHTFDKIKLKKYTKYTYQHDLKSKLLVLTCQFY